MITPNTGDIVDFELVNTSILFSKRSGVAVTAGSIKFDTAKLISPDIASRHTAIFPYFKDKVDNVDDPNAYDYMAFRNLNGQVEVIGIPWINEQTYKTITTRVANIVITNFQESYRAPIQTFLTNLGASFTFTVKDD